MHAHTKSLQLCPNLFYPMNCSWPGSSVHRILQARILEWVAMPSSKGSSRPSVRTQVSYIYPVMAGRFFTSSTSWEQCLWVHFSLHPCLYLFAVFLIIDILIDVRCYFSIVFICISLMFSNPEHLFTCLLFISMSSLAK